MAAFGVCSLLRAALALLTCTVSWAERMHVGIALEADEHLPLCAQKIVDQTCQAGHSALKLVSESTGSGEEAILPFLESLGLSHDASCRAVCGAVVDAVPAGYLPRRSGEGCRYDYDQSRVACDVSFLALNSEVVPSQEQPAEAPAEETAEELPPHRPVREGREAQAGTWLPRRALSRGEVLLQVANRFRIYPYRFPETAAKGALLEAPPQVHQQQTYQPEVLQPQMAQPETQQPVMPQPETQQPRDPQEYAGQAAVAFHFGVTDKQKRKVEEARVVAQAMLASSIAAMRLGEEDVADNMNKFFGVDSVDARQQVLRMLEWLNVEINNLYIFTESEQPGGLAARSSVLGRPGPCDGPFMSRPMRVNNGRYGIHLCKAFFRGIDFANAQGITKAGRVSVRAYTLIEDLLIHAGTEGYAEGGIGVRNLAREDPHSYALFCQAFHGKFW